MGTDIAGYTERMAHRAPLGQARNDAYEGATRTLTDQAPGLAACVFVLVDGFLAIQLAAQLDVDQLNDDGEGHREVDITLRQFEVRALGDEGDADQDEERESQHLDRRVPLDEG